MRPIGRTSRFRLLAALLASGVAFASQSQAASLLVQKTVGSTTTSLGTITAFEGGAALPSAKAFYSYANHEFGNNAPSLTDDRSHLFFVNTKNNGLSFFVVNDNGVNEAGGAEAANTKVTSSRALKFLVQDDPGDIYHGGVKKASKQFATHQTWFQDKTDGYVLGTPDPGKPGSSGGVGEGLQAGDTLAFSFTKLYGNKANHLTSWAAYTSDGGLIDLGAFSKHAKITFTVLPDTGGTEGSGISSSPPSSAMPGTSETNPDRTPLPVSVPLPAAGWGGLMLLGIGVIFKRWKRTT
jgi:hypothetical protein